MSTVLETPTANVSSTPAERLRTTMAAVRVSMSWFGTRKTLTAEQRAEAAEPFGTDARFLSAGKRLLDISHPAFKAVTAVRGKVIAFWKSMSLPYPEPGIRLIRQDKIDEFAAKMREFQEELAEAVETLDRHYSDLKATARQRLGSLFNAGDYPESLRGLFSVDFDFPSVRAPGLLAAAQPAALRRGVPPGAVPLRRGGALGRGGVHRRAGQAGVPPDRAAFGPGGWNRPKIFRNSAVENLTEFFQRFRELNVRSSEQLDRLVADAQRIIRGVEPQDLRDNAGLRQHVATEMSRVQSVLDGLLVDRPRRNILRSPK